MKPEEPDERQVDLDDDYEYLDEDAERDDTTVAAVFKWSLIAVGALAILVVVAWLLLGREPAAEVTEQAELVALMWIGRGDSEPEEWEELIKLAEERREVPTSDYLLDHPMVADHWAEALDKLGYGGIGEGVEEI